MGDGGDSGWIESIVSQCGKWWRSDIGELSIVSVLLLSYSAHVNRFNLESTMIVASKKSHFAPTSPVNFRGSRMRLPSSSPSTDGYIPSLSTSMYKMEL